MFRLDALILLRKKPPDLTLRRIRASNWNIGKISFLFTRNLSSFHDHRSNWEISTFTSRAIPYFFLTEGEKLKISSSPIPPSSSNIPLEVKLDPLFFAGFGWTLADLTGFSTGLAGSTGLSDSLDRPNRSTPPGNRATPPTGGFLLLKANVCNHTKGIVHVWVRISSRGTKPFILHVPTQERKREREKEREREEKESQG